MPGNEVWAYRYTAGYCEQHLIRMDPHLPGTVPFTGSVAALHFAQDLLMQELATKLSVLLLILALFSASASCERDFLSKKEYLSLSCNDHGTAY